MLIKNCEWLYALLSNSIKLFGTILIISEKEGSISFKRLILLGIESFLNAKPLRINSLELKFTSNWTQSDISEILIKSDILEISTCSFSWSLINRDILELDELYNL